MNKNILVLFPYTSMYYFDNVCNNEIDIVGVFKNSKTINNPIFKILNKLNLNATSLYYDSWFKEIKKYEKIIVFDSCLKFDNKILENIKKKVNINKLFFYSWNIVENEKRFITDLKKIKNEGFDVYSYNKNDCNKYHTKFNTIMYDKSLKIKKKEEKYDTIFLGFLKDKKYKLKNIYDLFIENKLNPKFVIVNDKEKDLPFEYKDKYINYYEYLDMLSESKSVLDITQKGQDGFSMRVMESIFLNKKLITTNLAIKKTDFYNENNILIIDENITKEKIKEFFNKPFIKYSEKVRDYYSIEEWVKRFK